MADFFAFFTLFQLSKTVFRLEFPFEFLLKLSYFTFHKICKFETYVTRNNVIMMSLTKTIEKCEPPRNQ